MSWMSELAIDAQWNAEHKPKSRGLGWFFDRFRPKATSADIEAVKTTADIAKFFKKFIRYRGDDFTGNMTDYWQRPKETICLGRGDVQDLAILAQCFLEKMRIESEVICIFSPTETYCICSYQRYLFFDRGKIRVGTDRFEETVDVIVPDWKYYGIMRREGHAGIVGVQFKRRKYVIGADHER